MVVMSAYRMATDEAEETLIQGSNGAAQDDPSAADATVDVDSLDAEAEEVARKRELLRQHKIRYHRRKRQEPTKQRQELMGSLMATLQATGDWPPPEQRDVQVRHTPQSRPTQTHTED